MFTAPPASPIPTSCAEFLRKRYPSILLCLPIDEPKTINKNKKSKTYIRMGRAQYRERRTGQKKEKSGRTGRAAIRRRKEEGERKVLAARGSRETNRRKEKARAERKTISGPKDRGTGRTRETGKNERKRRLRRREDRSRGRERPKGPQHEKSPRAAEKPKDGNGPQSGGKKSRTKEGPGWRSQRDGTAERQRGTGEERAIAAPKARKTEILTTNEDGTERRRGLALR